jgi:hypothetical protein
MGKPLPLVGTLFLLVQLGAQAQDRQDDARNRRWRLIDAREIQMLADRRRAMAAHDPVGKVSYSLPPDN